MTMSVTSPVFLQLLPSWCTAAFPPAGLLYDNVASGQSPRRGNSAAIEGKPD
jgi:hypothetical protein